MHNATNIHTLPRTSKPDSQTPIARKRSRPIADAPLAEVVHMDLKRREPLPASETPEPKISPADALNELLFMTRRQVQLLLILSEVRHA